jgi:hypothetical protein
MAKWNVGKKNGMWKGGRTVTRDGYVLIRVGKDHPLADCRGYAYEHRLKAQENLDHRLRSREQVHHRDTQRANNKNGNLAVARSVAHHRELAGQRNFARRVKHGRNPFVECACECGEMFRKFDAWGRSRRFVNGHNVGKRP